MRRLFLRWPTVLLVYLLPKPSFLPAEALLPKTVLVADE